MKTHKKKRNIHSTTQDVLESANSIAQKGELFLQKYAKPLGVLFGSVIIAVLGYILYDNFVITPQNTKASNLLIEAENLYVEGKEDQALGGKNSGVSGFVDIAEEYGKTKTGKLAYLYAGTIEFKKGNYQKALEYFQNFDSPDKDLKAVKFGAIADTYVELNNTESAMEYMTKAAKESDNAATAFQFNKKAGFLAMALNQNEKALAFFQIIKDKFPDIDQTGEVDAYIERLKYTIGK